MQLTVMRPQKLLTQIIMAVEYAETIDSLIRGLKADTAENQRRLSFHAANKFPILEVLKRTDLPKYTELIGLMQIADNPMEYLLEKFPQLVRDFLNEHENYSVHKFQENIKVDDIELMPFPFRSALKREQMKELQKFLEENPELKTTNVNLLRQRLCNHFLLKIQDHNEATQDNLLEAELKGRIDAHQDPIPDLNPDLDLT
jgi:hypothetical protein